MPERSGTACWTRADPDHVIKAHGESDYKAEKSSTAGTGHVAHSVNDNEEVTKTRAIKF
jgi:hypothetical protein